MNGGFMLFEGTDRRQGGRRQSDLLLLRRDRELDAARRISDTLFQHTEVEQLVEAALRTALEEVGAEAGSVLLADPDKRMLIFQYSIGEKPVSRGTAIPWDMGVSGAVFQSGKPAITGNVKQSSQYFAGIDQATGFVTREMITLPLKGWKGEPIGVMNVLNKRDGTLDENDLALLTIISAFAALALQQARLFEEAKKAEVVTLLGDIGHDLKNLLQPLVSGAWLLKGELDEMFARVSEGDGTYRKSQAFCDESIVMMQKTTERIHERVKEIADCVKGLNSPPNFGLCRLAKVLEDVLQTLRGVASEKEVTLATKGLEELPDFVADERRLYNAFYNLVSNAIPEVPAGGTVTVSARYDPSERMVLVAVADTGRGMPAEIRDRLFGTRAVTTKTGGTGLGTKIVKDVVDAHKGAISVESQEGKGTTFLLRLPLDPTNLQ
jgi:signal transduction histidine kinase